LGVEIGDEKLGIGKELETLERERGRERNPRRDVGGGIWCGGASDAFLLCRASR